MEYGRKSRSERIYPSSGMWTGLSCELHYDIKRFLNESYKNYKKGNLVTEPVFAIPLLFSCIRIMCIEIENYKEWNKKNNYQSDLLITFSSNENVNDIKDILTFYNANEKLKNEFEYAIQVRNEIVHPSPYPEKGKNLPTYLNYLKNKGVLWKPPIKNLGHNIFSYF